MDYVKPQGVVEHMLAMGGRTGTRQSRHREGKTVECLHIQITAYEAACPLENNQVVRTPESMSEKKDDEETQPAE
jgi:hypothetical protein